VLEENCWNVWLLVNREEEREEEVEREESNDSRTEPLREFSSHGKG
jgi:hypothetical protein